MKLEHLSWKILERLLIWNIPLWTHHPSFLFFFLFSKIFLFKLKAEHLSLSEAWMSFKKLFFHTPYTCKLSYIWEIIIIGRCRWSREYPYGFSFRSAWSGFSLKFTQISHKICFTVTHCFYGYRNIKIVVLRFFHFKLTFKKSKEFKVQLC